jgi:hypothetical protein
MAFNYSPKIVTDGLVLYLDAANPNSYVSGSTTWRDISRSGINGTLTNGPTFSSANGGSIVFDGVNDYVNLGDNYGFNNATFSYGGWFYFNGNSQDGVFLAKRNDSPFNQYNMAISNNATIGGNGTKLTCFANPDPGTTGAGSFMTFNYELASRGAGWYYAIVVINNNNQFLYVNGQSVLSSTRNYLGGTFLVPNKNLYIGATNVSNNPAGFWKSSFISQVQLYNRALSATEVLQNYNATKTRFGLT